MSNSDRKDGFFKRVGRVFAARKRHSYLEQHGYYDSFDDKRYARSPESYPYLPYSLQDLLDAKKISGMNVLVASHRSTALWLRRGGKNTVTLARPRRSGTENSTPSNPPMPAMPSTHQYLKSGQ